MKRIFFSILFLLCLITIGVLLAHYSIVKAQTANTYLYLNGNVGIGTSTVPEKFHVNGTNTDTKVEINGGGDQYTALRLKNSARSWNWQVEPSSFTGALRLFDETANAQRITIDSVGNVGIAKTNPVYPLDVVGDINFTGTLRQNGTAFGGGSSQWTTTGSNIYYNTGNVGIGTTTPFSPLEVQRSSSGVAATLWARAVGSTNNVGLRFSVADNGVTTDTYHKAGIFFEGISAGYGRGKLYIAQNNVADTTNVSVSNAVMTIDNAGNVGIGTVSPGRKLDVDGGNLSDWQIRIGRSGLGSQYTYDIGRNNNDALLHFYGNQSTLTGYVFDGVNGERMRITGTGNVGIGTTSPDATLHSVGRSAGIFDNNQTTTYTGGGKMYPGWYYATILGGGGAYSSPDGGGMPGGKFIGGNGGPNYGGGGAGIVAIGGNGSLYGRSGAGIYAKAGVDGSLATDGVPAVAGYFDGNNKNAILAMNGNVGIGTTSPVQKLQVSGNGLFTDSATTTQSGSGVILALNSTSTSALELDSRTGAAPASAIGGGEIFFNFSAQDANNRNVARLGVVTDGATAGQRGGALTFSTKANGSTTMSERLRIDNAGNVGIGTTSPGYRLQINSSLTKTLGGAGWGLNVHDTTTGGAAGVGGAIAFSAIRGADLGVFNAGAIAGLKTNSTDGNERGDLGFYTGSGVGGALAERMRIDYAGNVGIGTTNPTAGLHVVSPATGTVSVLIKQSGGQTANLLELRDSSNNSPIIVPAGAVSFRLETEGYGNDVAGRLIKIGRNSTVTGGAGTLQLEQSDGTSKYLWVDNSGDVRVHTAQTTGTTVALTAGTVVGTQTSSLDSKNVKGEFIDFGGALDTILSTPLFNFNYKSGAFNNQEFTGIITDYSPTFGMDRDAAHPGGKSFNPVTAFGYTVGAIKQLNANIASQSTQIASFTTAIKTGILEAEKIVVNGVLEAKKVVINGVDILDKVNKLESTVSKQQKTIEQLQKQVSELNKKVK